MFFFKKRKTKSNSEKEVSDHEMKKRKKEKNKKKKEEYEFSEEEHSSFKSLEENIITLNVGGHMFTTTKDTLLKGDTMLSKMFSGKYKWNCKEGNPFIDRDGSHFRYILNYLRSGRLVPPKDRQALEELLIEADYYGIKELSQEITSILEQERRVQYCKVLCTGDWIAQLNYLVENKGWQIFKFIMETESKYRELDDYGNPLKQGIGWYDIQTQCILLKKPVDYPSHKVT